MGKRCLRCDCRAYLADAHCQRCGAPIVPRPPLWLARFGYTFRVLIMLAAPLQVYLFGSAVLRTEQGRSALELLRHFGRYLVANGSEIASVLFAFVVAPLVGLYFALKAMVDIGDAIELKMQEWRVERFRKYGW